MTNHLIGLLADKATRLRIHSINSTSEAGSGHPTSCMSAADVVAALFFHVMRYDPQNAKHPNNDRFILSKGHAAPVLYAAWAEAGIVTTQQLLSLRRIDSDLEGHPTPRLKWVDVATGSLGQGLSAGVGMALNALANPGVAETRTPSLWRPCSTTWISPRGWYRSLVSGRIRDALGP